MNKSDTITKLASALAGLQAELSPVKRNADNPFFKSEYADLAACWNHVRPLLAKHKLAIAQPIINGHDGTVTVETILLHESGEWLAGSMTIKPVKPDPQSYGSAVTYCRRFGLTSLISLAQEGSDDDGNAASDNHPAHKPAPAPAPAPEPDVVNHVEGTVEDVTVREGDKNGKKWKKYGIKIAGSVYGTFDHKLGDLAQASIGAPVLLTWKADGAYKTAIDLEPM